MNDYNEILRYMGHKGAADTQLEALVTSCLEMLNPVSAPHHVTIQLPCLVAENRVTIGELVVESPSLAAHLCNCTQVYIFAATLGAAVDRLITQRGKIDSVEALCLQACATAQIEDYCNGIEQELSRETEDQGLYLRPRFSPGYGDFDIAHQTDILRLLQAHKRIGLTETNAHMLVPLKSVTAVIGISAEMPIGSSVDCEQDKCVPNKCIDCNKTDCSFKLKEVLIDD